MPDTEQITKEFVAAQVRELRAELLMTQEELAAAAGTRVDNIRNIEQAKCWPTFPIACGLADALGVPLDALRGREG